MAREIWSRRSVAATSNAVAGSWTPPDTTSAGNFQWDIRCRCSSAGVPAKGKASAGPEAVGRESRKRPGCHPRKATGQAPAEPTNLFGKLIGVVAGEHLVTAVPRERDRDLSPCEFRYQKGRNLRRVGERLVEHLRKPWNDLHRLLRRHDQFVMACAKVAGDGARERRLVPERSSVNPIEKVWTGRGLCACIAATTSEESIPPDRKAPRNIRRHAEGDRHRARAHPRRRPPPAPCPRTGRAARAQRPRPTTTVGGDRGLLGAVRNRRDGAGRELPYALVDAVGRRHVSVAEECGQSPAGDRRGKLGMRGRRSASDPKSNVPPARP